MARFRTGNEDLVESITRADWLSVTAMTWVFADRAILGWDRFCAEGWFEGTAQEIAASFHDSHLSTQL